MKSTFAEPVRPWCDVRNNFVGRKTWDMTLKPVMKVAPAVAAIVFATFAAPTQAKMQWQQTDGWREHIIGDRRYQPVEMWLNKLSEKSALPRP